MISEYRSERHLSIARCAVHAALSAREALFVRGTDGRKANTGAAFEPIGSAMSASMGKLRSRSGNSTVHLYRHMYLNRCTKS
jgi:hypothetical protein